MSSGDTRCHLIPWALVGFTLLALACLVAVGGVSTSPGGKPGDD